MSTAPHTVDEYTGPALTAHDMMYLRIALILGVLTAIEVTLSYTSLHHAALALPLLGLAAVKFITVAGYFMHLKFDSPLLRRLFVGGAVLAGFCYMAVLHFFVHFTGWVPWIIYVVFAVFLLVNFVFRGGPLTEGQSAHEHAEGDDHGHDHAHAH